MDLIITRLTKGVPRTWHVPNAPERAMYLTKPGMTIVSANPKNVDRQWSHRQSGAHIIILLKGIVTALIILLNGLWQMSRLWCLLGVLENESAGQVDITALWSPCFNLISEQLFAQKGDYAVSLFGFALKLTKMIDAALVQVPSTQ